ncbi:hypothetical protein, partial [Streptomyces sp. HNM0574]|uniref:hypothetical protein n=1 Tax=Streptomyces sp. HNM0574 TaxID=2714954 RepID=UPI0019D0EF15
RATPSQRTERTRQFSTIDTADGRSIRTVTVFVRPPGTRAVALPVSTTAPCSSRKSTTTVNVRYEESSLFTRTSLYGLPDVAAAHSETELCGERCLLPPLWPEPPPEYEESLPVWLL